MKRRSFLRLGGLTVVAATVPTLALGQQAERVKPAVRIDELKAEILRPAVQHEVWKMKGATFSTEFMSDTVVFRRSLPKSFT